MGGIEEKPDKRKRKGEIEIDFLRPSHYDCMKRMEVAHSGLKILSSADAMALASIHVCWN